MDFALYSLRLLTRFLFHDDMRIASNYNDRRRVMNGLPTTVKCGRGLVVLAALALGVLVDVAGRASSPELLEEVSAGNKSALESIRTLSCRITVVSSTAERGPMASSTAEFWQSADSWRVHSPGSGQLIDMVKHDFTTRKLYKKMVGPGNEEKIVFAIARAHPDESHLQFDAFGRGLLKLYGPDGRPLTLEKLLSREHTLAKVSRQPYQGRECVVIEMSIPMQDKNEGRFEIWFDPKVNYLACKLVGQGTVHAPKHMKVRSEAQVSRFVEVAPGIYFPAETEKKYYQDDKLSQHEVITFTEIQVNQPVPKSIFELPIPPNAKVLDAIEDREYKVDSNGRAFGPERSLPKGSPLPAGSAQAETATEPASFASWILYGLVCVLAIAGSAWYWRRLRGSAPSE